MAFEGNLETMPVADLLQWAANGRQTGTIRVSTAEITKMIYIREGVIVSCTSSDPREFLGHFLVSKGAIDEADLQGAIIDHDRSSGMLGQLLVERGALSQEQLHSMLRLKAEEAIFDLFTWTEGRFLFLEGELPAYELVPISLDVTGLVLEGMRRIDEWTRILESIPSMLCVPVAVQPLIDTGEEIDPGRLSVLESVDDDRSIEDICLHTHSSEFHVCEILYREVRDGRIKMVRPRVSSQPVEVSKETDGESLVSTARDLLTGGDLERTVRCLKAAVILDDQDHALREIVAEVEREVRGRFTDEGLGPQAVPVLDTDLEDLPKLDLEPSEGFILSRIDGRSTVDAIVKISPLPELDALLVLWMLREGGHIRLD
jgi:hypothetical protein